MTVIVGLIDKKTKRVYIGADRGLFDDDNHVSSPASKIMKRKIGANHHMILGNSGDLRSFDILEHSKFDKLGYDPEKISPKEFVVKKLIPEFQRLFRAASYAKPDFEILIGFDGEIFEIYEDWSVVVPNEYGSGVGSAAPPALGVLHAFHNQNIKMSTKRKIKAAVEASINISNFARGPIDILWV
jgi:hypothetical protein